MIDRTSVSNRSNQDTMETEHISTQLNDSTDDNDLPTTRLPEFEHPFDKSTRKRLRNPEYHKKEKNKRRRNAGRPYKSINGDLVPPRTIGDACQCKNECRSLLLGMELQLFHSFWDLGTYDKQNLYLGSHIHVEDVKRHYKSRTKDLTKSPIRNVSYKYSVDIMRQQIFICKKEFLAVHGLQLSPKRVEILGRKLRDGMLISNGDARGKHKNHRRVGVDSLNMVREHINNILKNSIKYSREENPKKVYLDCDITIVGLYRKYCEWINEKNKDIENEHGVSGTKVLNPTKELEPYSTDEANVEHNYESNNLSNSLQKIEVVSEDKYRRIFCSEYNIGLKSRRSDAKKDVAKQKARISSKLS